MCSTGLIRFLFGVFFLIFFVWVWCRCGVGLVKALCFVLKLRWHVFLAYILSSFKLGSSENHTHCITKSSWDGIVEINKCTRSNWKCRKRKQKVRKWMATENDSKSLTWWLTSVDAERINGSMSSVSMALSFYEGKRISRRLNIFNRCNFSLWHILPLRWNETAYNNDAF